MSDINAKQQAPVPSDPGPQPSLRADPGLRRLLPLPNTSADALRPRQARVARRKSLHRGQHLAFRRDGLSRGRVDVEQHLFGGGRDRTVGSDA